MKYLSSISTGTRRLAAVFGGIALALGAVAIGPASASFSGAARLTWVASWAASPMPGTSSAQATTGLPNQTVDNYIASGNRASDAAATGYTTTTGSWYYVDGLDVRSSTAAGTIVAFGDSITDGYQSLAGSNARWPNYLARRLDRALGTRAPGVVDEGISGNRVLNNSSCFGVSARARFARDALSQPGVKAVILLEGINDIGFAGEADTGCYTPNDPTVTAARIEAGYLDLIRMAHARGVKVYGGTLTPFAGSNPGYGGNYGTAKGETLREQVNDWIRTSGAFDGVIDFARATADAYDPLYLNPVYNSGDSLHPGDLGYEAMAATVPLRFVR